MALERKTSNVYANYTVTNITFVLDFNEQFYKMVDQLDDLRFALDVNKTSKRHKELKKISESLTLIKL
jgi:hypothetical protein